MKRTTLRIDGTAYALAQGQNIDAIKRAVVQGVRDGGDLITLTVVGNKELDILVTAGVPVTFESEEIAYDNQDNGDLAAPYLVGSYDDYAL
jgi:hypothetical protein